MNFIKKIGEKLSKTHEKLVSGINQILGRGVIDDEAWEELEMLLLTADVGVKTTTELISRLKKKGLSSTEELKSALIQEVSLLLEPYSGSLVTSETKPLTIMVIGVNGVGKTTTIAKLANYFINNGKKVILGACDTFRAAASEQLEIWARRAGVDIVKQTEGADPAAVAYDSLSSAIAKGYDVLIIDTAGRLHTKSNLMEELKKIKRVLKKIADVYPQETLLVLDATVGQNAVSQVKTFKEAIDITGIVMTKLDGTAKGGILINVVREFGIPVKFVGLGEKIDDIETFDPNAYAEGLFK
ncbi:MAG: signal recognition particle-docking protein FtsY [bacterium]